LDLGEAMAAGNEGSLHLLLQDLETVSHMAVRLCLEHTAAKDVNAEDLWFGLLHEVVELVHAVGSLAFRGENESVVHGDSSTDQLVLDSLRSLVQGTLSSLVSSSNTCVSFPSLFKRLIDASTATRKENRRGRAYSEFRGILSGMLESYRAEGDMLTMTTRLVEADLFVAVEELAYMRQRGWRPVLGECDVCGRETLGAEIKSGKSMIVLGSGEVVHLACLQTALNQS